MLFDGQAIQCELDKSTSIIHVIFNIKESSSNVVNALMVSELPKAYDAVSKCKEAKGVLLRSAKETFIFGADITEFLDHFKKTEEDLQKWLLSVSKVLNQFEDLEIPSVTCINGFALGGGFEICLTTDFRVAASSAKVGLPETKLGIMPGWGGSVRLPRIAGADHAIEWITSGKQYKATDALKVKVVDAVVDEDKLVESGILLLQRAIEGKIDWKNRKIIKKSPLLLNKIESMMVFETAKGFVAGVAGPNYPAPVRAIEVMQQSARLTRDEALKIEAVTFSQLGQTLAAKSLVQVFLGDQYLKKVSKKLTKSTEPTKQAAVLGAGIMGGGIAYQSASKGTPIIMKDINSKAIDLGLGEATKLLNKLVTRKKITTEKMAKTLNIISPALSYGEFDKVDMVVEAVVENVGVKQSVLKELESKVSDDTILASNTSTISITELGSVLKRPENFCGMHFFNPVHKMPLVEVIVGEQTSEKAIAKTVKYALQMGKTPIVVKDCPGFLVNRILFPYLNGFSLLIEDGVDYKRIDKVMEKFGWPMGPAYLLDVVGIDTADHAAKIMALGFSDRMKLANKSIVEVMHEGKRLGQKNGIGFYAYTLDKKGRPKKSVDPETENIIKGVVKKTIEITDEEIVERMMIPMIIESSRCFEEKIVQTPQEVDMGLLLGVGFPPFRSGSLMYADTIGMNNLINMAAKYHELGKMYVPTKQMNDMAKNNNTYYQA